MNIQDLDFPYPERLVATERLPKSRVMLVRQGAPASEELSELGDLGELVPEFRKGDLLVVNDTRVLKRRVFTEAGLEILFLKSLNADRTDWQVLCPSSRWKPEQKQVLPQGVDLDLIERGRIQVVRANQPLAESFFEAQGEMPLPPYIQKARGERHNRATDQEAYQTAWARNDGSLAAPTASLHFQPQHLAELETKGVRLATVTLHVGLGTFLPIHADNLDEHVMHAEFAEIPAQVWQQIAETKAQGGRVWALGTTVTRTLESAAHGKLQGSAEEGFTGETDLFIRPGFEFKVVDCLLTNFHQPRSTLIALVAAFSSLEKVKSAYAWAIEREFRLFSYGDLTAWIK